MRHTTPAARTGETSTSTLPSSRGLFLILPTTSLSSTPCYPTPLAPILSPFTARLA
jgi:hypothetical protein